MKNKWIWVWIAVMLAGLAAALSPTVMQSPKGAPLLTKDQLKKMFHDPDLVILDVRTGIDWEASRFKIQGAVRDEYRRVHLWIDKYDKGKTYVLY